jgi:sigma-B regulation protein RsbU (phosphoserine phosphatase)
MEGAEGAMTLRTRLGLLTSGLGVAVVVLTLAVVRHVLVRNYTNDARKEAESTAEALEQSLMASLDSYRVEAQILADETMLKEALIKGSDPLAFTYADAARDRAGVRYIAVANAEGRVVAAVGLETRAGEPSASIARAVEGATESRTGFAVLGDQFAVVAVVPIKLGERALGVLLLGDPVSAEQLRRVERVWRASVTLVDRGGYRVVSTLPDPSATLVAGASTCGEAHGTRDVQLDGEPHLLVVRALDDLRGGPLGCIAVARSLSSRRDALRGLERLLAACGAGLVGLAAVAALFLAARVSRAIARPLQRLSEAARGLQQGDMGARAPVLVEDEIGELARTFNLMGEAVASRQERLMRELDLARQIQLSLVPRRIVVPGFELAAHMDPAAEVGGDYYDVLEAPDGCWIGIGDVAGHGLDAGLVVLMMQSVVAATIGGSPSARPRDVVVAVNTVLFENIRRRLAKDLHATFSILRCRGDGRVTFAGAHEDIVVCRAATGRCEIVRTPGTWVGAMPNVARATVDADLLLQEGDLLVLYTDGLIEARCRDAGRFGLDRVCVEIERVRDRPVEGIQRHLLSELARVAPHRDDDVSLVVVRYASASDATAEGRPSRHRAS